MKIWKSVIEPNSVINAQHVMKVPMPAGAVPLCVMVVDGQVCIYAEVDPQAPIENCVFYSVGTGHGDVPTGGRKYLGTVNWPLEHVWHIYY